ncbi:MULTISPECIES: hypothetical protein [unclassified Nitratiruptor]|uniref:hypothetical protein n=1 Tax=unclassified Nitratiruptor TaxID=2624044 RepID=UPI001915C40F|nr:MULTISPECIES: hypothetical protein [unclassified Nitratiruptor]BCD59485.1 anticodon nuclease [Nitratiruptor sp. YY08-10]BCD63409.1 anticodon nuclease [Nitratiruptor sp. YY08-14]
MTINNIAKKIIDSDKKIILLYAFNTTGKTRLSVEFKKQTKINSDHIGVYYNAFSEDLFVWDNDETNIRLKIIPSSLNNFHSSLTEDNIKEKLQPYKFNFDFRFNSYNDPEKGIESIYFFTKNSEKNIKISRGEERIFIWCFF